MEAKAMYKFDGSQDDELSFKEGDILKIKSMDGDQNWYQAEKEGRIGFVPSTYIQMEPHAWYKGKMSRTDAEAFLMRSDASGNSTYLDGAFVVRDCESDKNQFSLSVKHGLTPQHFKILSNADGCYYLWPNKTYRSINKLIDHHRTVSIAREPHVSILLRDLQENVMFEAVYDFNPEAQEEVALRRGDKIKLIEYTDENWWMGQVVSSGKQGLFPRNYVKEVK